MDIDPFASLHITLSSSSRPHSHALSAHMSADRTGAPTIYFGYGSNLWRHQMRQRCPTSRYMGIARLRGYKWIISSRGYANVVQIDKDGTEAPGDEHEDWERQVWALVYSLEREDERRLDGNEGVPVAYQKEWIECEFWRATAAPDDDGDAKNIAHSCPALAKPDLSRKPTMVDMLVYINREGTDEGVAKREYVYRMNMGIRDALKEGLPEGYVEKAMRRFIPEKEEEGVKEIARRQALRFEEER